MPLWVIYHPPTTFTSEESKSGLAKAITKLYIDAKLPPFYVNVLFQPLDPSSIYIGGVVRPSPHSAANEPGGPSDRPFIRLTIQHIARSLPTDAIRVRFMRGIDDALKPYIEDKGYDWEYSIIETSRDLWKVQGLVPPMPNTKAEQEWVRLNRAVPFELEDGGLAGSAYEQELSSEKTKRDTA